MNYKFIQKTFSRFLLVFTSLGLLTFFSNFIFVSQVFAVGNSVVPGQMTLSTTFNSIGIEVLFTDDDNRDATATLEFKKTSDTNWRAGLDLWRVDGNDDSTPIDNIGRGFYGSALTLESNTQYDIKVTVSDPDGGGTVLNQSITTTQDFIPSASSLTPTYFVRTDGSDSNSGTSDSPSGAWKTIQKAVRYAPSGSVVQVGPGYYVQPTNYAPANVTFIAQYPAVDDNLDVINDGQHSVIEPGNAVTFAPAVASPTNSSDPNPGVWQQVNLTGPGYAGATASTNYTVWKWSNVPTLNSTYDGYHYVGYASTRDGIPQRIAHWKKDASHLATPEGWVEKMHTNQSYNYGYYVDGSDLYLKLPPNAPSQDPNDLYITASSDKAFNISGANTRFSGFEMRGFYKGFNLLGSSSNIILDHNLLTSTNYPIFLQYGGSNPNFTYSSGNVFQYNRFIDTNLATEDHTNSPAIPWKFIKSTVVNADGSTYPTTKIGGQAEGTAIHGSGGGRQIVIRNNYFEGFFNGVGSTGGKNRYGSYDYDIYNNTFKMIADDTLEPEGVVINFRVWNNTAEKAISFLSTGPVHFGPVYIFKNTGWEMGGSIAGRYNDGALPVSGKFFKYSGTSVPTAKVFVVNNTLWSNEVNFTGGGQSATNGSNQEAFYLRNNIMRSTNYIWDVPTTTQWRWDEDYNFLATIHSSVGLRYKGVHYTTNVSGYRTASGGGAETNKDGSSDVAFNNTSVIDSHLSNPASGDFNLISDSTFISKGVIVPNISDIKGVNYGGFAPELGAIEVDTLSCNLDLDTGKVGHWKMDESSWNGTTGEVVDSSSSNKNGTSMCSGASCSVPSTTNAKFNSGGSFDGVDDYASMGSLGASNDFIFSYSVWVKTTETDSDNWLLAEGSQSSVNGRAFGIINEGGKARIQAKPSSGVTYTVTGTKSISDGNWHHIAFVADGANMYLYTDGQLEGQTAVAGTTNSTLSSIGASVRSTGGNNVSRFAMATLDEARVYDRALSAAEVTQLSTSSCWQ